MGGWEKWRKLKPYCDGHDGANRRHRGMQIKNRSFGKPGFGFLRHDGYARYGANPW